MLGPVGGCLERWMLWVQVFGVVGVVCVLWICLCSGVWVVVRGLWWGSGVGGVWGVTIGDE